VDVTKRFYHLMQRLESASKGQDPWLTKQFESDPDLQKEVSRTLDLWCARVKYLLHTKAPTQASTPAFAWCMCRRRLAILLLTISCSLTRWHCQQIHDRKVVEEYCKIWLGVLEERRKEVEDAQVFSRPLYSSHRQYLCQPHVLVFSPKRMKPTRTCHAWC
jgi:hypothetical protein